MRDANSHSVQWLTLTTDDVGSVPSAVSADDRSRSAATLESVTMVTRDGGNDAVGVLIEADCSVRNRMWPEAGRVANKVW